MHSGPEMVTEKTCIKMAKLENYPQLAKQSYLLNSW